MTNDDRLREHVAEARAALACIPRTRHRMLWQADPASVRAIVAALGRYREAGGSITSFAAELGVDPTVLGHMRDGMTPDGRRIGGPASDACEAVKAGARIVTDMRARSRAAGLKRLDWRRSPDDVLALGRAWLRSGMTCSTFCRAIDVDPTVLKLHFRTSQGDTAREALQDALERITRLEAMLADALASRGGDR